MEPIESGSMNNWYYLNNGWRAFLISYFVIFDRRVTVIIKQVFWKKRNSLVRINVLLSMRSLICYNCIYIYVEIKCKRHKKYIHNKAQILICTHCCLSVYKRSLFSEIWELFNISLIDITFEIQKFGLKYILHKREILHR